MRDALVRARRRAAPPHATVMSSIIEPIIKGQGAPDGMALLTTDD
jgi:hypothetical protein